MRRLNTISVRTSDLISDVPLPLSLSSSLSLTPSLFFPFASLCVVSIARAPSRYCVPRKGVCYAKGEGVVQDWKKAVEWYQRAADQGHALAQCNLGTQPRAASLPLSASTSLSLLFFARNRLVLFG